MVSLTGCATAKAPILRVAPVAALPPTAPVPIGYAVIQSVHVKGPGGLEQGAIQLLEDNRLTPDLRQELWGKVIDPARAEERAKVFALAHPGAVQPARSDLYPAQIRLVLPDGRIAIGKTLPTPLAGVEDVSLYGTDKMTYLLTQDETDAGASSGILSTVAFEIADLRFEPVTFVSDLTHTAQPIRLAAAKHSAWRLVEARDGDGKEIESITCRPILSRTKADLTRPGFELTYSSYLFDGKQWHETSQHKPGCWEDDQDFPQQGDFP